MPLPSTTPSPLPVPYLLPSTSAPLLSTGPSAHSQAMVTAVVDALKPLTGIFMLGHTEIVCTTSFACVELNWIVNVLVL
eukprot:748366-Hanusia_phi.AAC.2